MAERQLGVNPRRRRLLLAIVGLAAGIGSIPILLFTGSEVGCDEILSDERPALRCVFTVGAAQDAVWQAFTTTDEPQRHYFDAVLEAETWVGGRWRFVTGDRQRLLAGGKILEFEPTRRFSQTFQAADLNEAPSRITIEIEPLSEGSAASESPSCRVSLVHDQFVQKTVTYRRFRGAHPLALSALKARLETGRLPIRARIYTFLFKPGMNLVRARAEPWQ